MENDYYDPTDDAPRPPSPCADGCENFAGIRADDRTWCRECAEAYSDKHNSLEGAKDGSGKLVGMIRECNDLLVGCTFHHSSDPQKDEDCPGCDNSPHEILDRDEDADFEICDWCGEKVFSQPIPPPRFPPCKKSAAADSSEGRVETGISLSEIRDMQAAFTARYPNLTNGCSKCGENRAGGCCEKCLGLGCGCPRCTPEPSDQTTDLSEKCEKCEYKKRWLQELDDRKEENKRSDREEAEYDLIVSQRPKV